MKMTVKKLIKLLEKQDPNRVVVLASDGEGNSYSYLSEDWFACSYDELNREVGLEALTPELVKKGYSEEDVIEGVPALVLYP